MVRYCEWAERPCAWPATVRFVLAGREGCFCHRHGQEIRARRSEIEARLRAVQAAAEAWAARTALPAATVSETGHAGKGRDEMQTEQAVLDLTPHALHTTPAAPTPAQRVAGGPLPAEPLPAAGFLHERGHRDLNAWLREAYGRRRSVRYRPEGGEPRAFSAARLHHGTLQVHLLRGGWLPVTPAGSFLEDAP